MTAKTETILIDAYRYGDRLLDGCDFAVTVTTDFSDDTFTIDNIEPSTESASYMADIRWEKFVPAVKRDMVFAWNHTKKWAAGEGTTLAEFVKDNGLAMVFEV